MASAAHKGRPKGIDASNLYKIWRIELDSANKTLEATYQNSTRSNNPTISRNFGTKYRMLRYKIIKEHLLMETLF